MTRSKRSSYRLRAPKPGDYGWVVERHGALYAQEYGWNEEFEGIVAQIVADYIKNRDPKRERAWIAELGGERVGSIFLVKKTKTTAKLRLLLVEPQARGIGLGRRLVKECIRHARRVGYKKIELWTDSLLTTARSIYEQSGFILVRSDAHHDFGHHLVGERWELKL